MGDPGVRKNMQRVNLNWEPEGAVDANLYLRYNYDDTSTPQPDVFSIVITPIAPHSLTSRPLVLPSNVEVEFRFNQDSENELKLIADGQNIINFTKDSTVKLSQAKHHLKFITFKDYNYYETLKKKMIWGKRGS